MTKRCCIQNCMSKWPQQSLYRFPHPVKDTECFNKWVELIGNTALVNAKPMSVYKHYRVCGKHFAKTDFNRYNRLQRMALPYHHLLQAGTAPTDLENGQTTDEPAEQMTMIQVKEEPEEEFDESFWANPRFTSLQGCLEAEGKSLTKICRICLKPIENDKWQILTTDDANFQSDIQNKVKFILPNINLNVFTNSLVCNQCVELVNYSIELQEKWLSSEERLNDIIDEKRTERTVVNDIIIMVDPPTMEIIEEPAFYQVDISTPSCINEPINSHQNVTNENALLPHEANTQSILNEPISSHQNVTNEHSLSPPEADTQIILQNNLSPVIEPFAANFDKQKESIKKSKKQAQSKKTNYNIIICSVCSEVFTFIANYAIHTSQHIETKNTCVACKKKFQNTKVLYHHMKVCLRTNNEHEIDQGLHEKKATEYRCEICNKEFLFSWYLTRHRQICTSNKIS